MPARYKLLTTWLFISGFILFAGFIAGAWLTSQLETSLLITISIYLACLATGVLMFLVGALLENKLLAPLRHLQIQLSRIVANPDADDDFPPEGWLANLQPDLMQIRQAWKQDRQQIQIAKSEGAQEAATIRQELEALLQVLKTPLLLCDKYQRLLLFNPAAEKLFAANPALGLGRHVSELLPAKSLQEALTNLPEDGSPRQLLIPHESGWYLGDLRKVLASQGQALLMLEDATASQQSELSWSLPLARLLPALRGHAANLATAGELLSTSDANQELKQRLQTAMYEDGQALASLVTKLAELVEGLYLDKSLLSDTWSNDLFNALAPSLAAQGIKLTPLGIPLWFKADTPSLLALLNKLIRQLHTDLALTSLEAEMQLGNAKVYLDLIWQGDCLSLKHLEDYKKLSLISGELGPSLGDLLRRHASDWWCLTHEHSNQVRLRLPLPSATRVYPPEPVKEPRPEFHDFSIANLPPPTEEVGNLALNQINLVVLDSETTGLELTKGDKIISLGACRLVNGKLLAQEVFDQKVNPERAIPPASTKIHGLTDADVANSPPMQVVMPKFKRFVGQSILVAHNAAFDLLALELAGQPLGISFTNPVLDTLWLSRFLDPNLEDHSLDGLAARLNINFPPNTRHTALGDARVTAEVLLALLPRLKARGINTLNEALAVQAQQAGHE